jgi:hypothetical protein
MTKPRTLIIAGAAIAAVLAWNLATAPRLTRDQAAARCAEIAGLGRDHADLVGVPSTGPAGYRNGVLTSGGCSFIATREAGR